MTNPDAEREAEWQEYVAGNGLNHYCYNAAYRAFIAGYAAARASAAPAPDAGEREAIRHNVTEFMANRMRINAATLAQYVLTLVDADPARDQALILQGVKAGLEAAALVASSEYEHFWQLRDDRLRTLQESQASVHEAQADAIGLVQSVIAALDAAAIAAQVAQ